ncbi:hypothetical protein ACFQY7_21990 [Actinomadura luteofluorescens]|uniref:hypothetical protein n=1 Tax=Actinomadura luteofluorescens TaxID=46163 RepID=UPI00363235B5
MPSIRVTRSPASSSRVVSPTQPPCSNSSTTTLACSVVVPDPRSFGRSQAGERETRRRRPRMVVSSTTRGPAPGGAWSLRSPFTALRTPGTCP